MMLGIERMGLPKNPFQTTTRIGSKNIPNKKTAYK